MEYQQPLPHNKESGCAPNIRFQLEYSCKDGCRFIKTCSIDTIRCWIATSKEALLIQNSNHKVTQASANCLARFLGRPIRKLCNSPSATQPLSSPLPPFAPSICNQSVIPPAPQKSQISSQPRTRRVPMPTIKPICGNGHNFI
jgi:hypothetical protein